MTIPLTRKGVPIPAALDEALIRRVVFGFYAKVRVDDVLGPIFAARIADDAWPVHLRRMCDFWSSILLRTDRYAGRPLLPHLAINEIEDGTFDRWLSLFGRTVEEECDPDSGEPFLELADRIARSFRMAIAFHRGESILPAAPAGPVPAREGAGTPVRNGNPGRAPNRSGAGARPGAAGDVATSGDDGW
jgi:hemoglobin